MGEINGLDPGTARASAVVWSSGVVWTLSRWILNACLDADPVVGNRIPRIPHGQSPAAFAR